MQLDRILYDIREATKEYIDDTEIDDRYLIHLLNIKRSKYLKQKLNAMQRVTDTIITQTFAIPVEKVSAEECNLGFTCDTLLRTCRVIPDPLQLHTKNGIIRVAPIDRLSRPFNFVTRDRIVYAKDAPYPNSIYAFLHDDGYLYLSTGNAVTNVLECISISGVWEDPTQLFDFSTCCDCNTEDNICFTIESEYPLHPDLVDIIKQEIVLDILRIKQIPEDKSNDGND